MFSLKVSVIIQKYVSDGVFLLVWFMMQHRKKVAQHSQCAQLFVCTAAAADDDDDVMLHHKSVGHYYKIKSRKKLNHICTLKVITLSFDSTRILTDADFFSFRFQKQCVVSPFLPPPTHLSVRRPMSVHNQRRQIISCILIKKEDLGSACLCQKTLRCGYRCCDVHNHKPVGQQQCRVITPHMSLQCDAHTCSYCNTFARTQAVLRSIT